jgi:phosphoribosylaminoimidazole carboxylase (NCAIR synthetase)
MLLLLWDVVPLQNNIAVGEFADTPTEAAVVAVGAQFGYPLMLKAKKMAYDGKVYILYTTFSYILQYKPFTCYTL